MENRRTVPVLSLCRSLIKILSVFNNKIDWRFALFDTLLIFIVPIILCGACLMLILIIWFCFDHNFNLKEISTAITFSISVIQLCLVSIIFSKNRQFISESVDLLQSVINKRRYPSLCEPEFL